LFKLKGEKGEEEEEDGEREAEAVGFGKGELVARVERRSRAARPTGEEKEKASMIRE
jgi:hypothetical protein